MPVLVLLVALVASACAQSLQGVHQRLEQIERKLEKDAECRADQGGTLASRNEQQNEC